MTFRHAVLVGPASGSSRRNVRTILRGMRFALSASSVLLVLVACAGPDIDGAQSCAELEKAWEEAGGLNAEASVHLDVMDRVNELGSADDLPEEEMLRCADLFIEAQKGLDCHDPTLSLPAEFCS